MKYAFSAIFLVAICVWPGCRPGVAQSSPIFEIHQPTIIAFFPITQAEVDNSEDAGEALGDFDYYVSKVEKRLHRAGIAIHLVNSGSFQVRAGNKTVTIRPKKGEIGYYFIAPDRGTAYPTRCHDR